MRAGIRERTFEIGNDFTSSTEKSPLRDILKREEVQRIARGERRGDRMPVSKKQLEKLNKVKKVKAEELAKQAATGSESAKKKLKKLQKKIK